MENRYSAEICTEIPEVQSAELSSGISEKKSVEIPSGIPEAQSVEIPSGIPEAQSVEIPSVTPEEVSASSPASPPTRPPLYGCAFSGAVTATFQVDDAATVLHGPGSCTHITADALACSYLRGRGRAVPTGAEKQTPGLLPTDMEEEDVIFGGLEKLERRIEEALLTGWQTVFVVNTCPGGIIGDDIREAASRAEVRFPGARVIPVPVEGVLTGDFSTGLLEGCKRVADLIDPSVRPEKGLVNVIGERSFFLRGEEDFRTVERLLKRLGYGVNCRFLKGTDTLSLRSLKKAEINLLACDDPETRALQAYLSGRFGLEFFELPFPVGFRESSLWVKALAARLLPGKDPSPLLQEQENAYKAGIGKYAPHLSGKSVLLVSYSEDIGWVLDTIRDLGMEILKVGIPVSCFGRESPGLLSREGFPVERNYTDAKRAKDVRGLRPDLVLSSYVPSAPEEGVHYDTIPFSPQVGFLSGLELAKRWSTLLRLPVTEGWKYDGGDES
nr:nitrogenase component 1 [Methanosarcina sp. KYL-1]